MTGHRIPFNKPYAVGREFDYIRQAIASGHLSGDGAFSRRCHAWLERRVGCRRALLTHSCTAALEMAAILADIRRGDEVIMPSFTFASTANAVVLRGGVPVFLDIREDTLNVDETQVAGAIGPRTKAILVVHYAGVGAEMDRIMARAETAGIQVIEDAAQALMSSYKSRPLGSIGHMAAVSFHETKNVSAGEGGAILINDPARVMRAEIIREKGTNRSQFFRGEVDKYTWVDLGSSYLPSEITAAFLWAQLEQAEMLTKTRLGTWELYHAGLAALEQRGDLRRPIIPAECAHNAHMYYVLVAEARLRKTVLGRMNAEGVNAVFHYVPLHSSPAGRAYGRAVGDLPRTVDISERLIRLPLWIGMTEADVGTVIDALTRAL